MTPNFSVIDDKVVAKERKKDFEISRISRLRHRTRYFTDSGIIGSKEFVAENYQRFKHLFYSKHEKRPKPIKGLEGMYSLKRSSEVIFFLTTISNKNFFYQRSNRFCLAFGIVHDVPAIVYTSNYIHMKSVVNLFMQSSKHLPPIFPKGVRSSQKPDQF